MPLELVTAVAACCVLLYGFLVAAPAGAVDVRCSDRDLPATGPLGEPAAVHGRFCLPEAVRLLVHGGTYDSADWDLPYDPDRCSCRRDMAKHGYATFAADQFGSLGSEPLHSSTKPGARAGLFSATENTDPKVVEADEAAKDQVSVPGMGTVAVFGIGLPATNEIRVPVLQAVGSGDILFCGLFPLRDCSSGETLRRAEAPFYRPEAGLSTYVLSGAGHSPALHRNASRYRDATRMVEGKGRCCSTVG
ncbi:hypothetical protein ACFWIW_20155 [Amycolatopsis sp. NPDC058340]|uniref:hypothetical protein n=1 Tax=Amycolatopsis sp. NPDC058340 TaxID=3346453 RepID=UPI0036555473